MDRDEFPLIESLDPTLVDEVQQVFTSESNECRSARNLYEKRRIIWIPPIEKVLSTRVIILAPSGAEHLKSLPAQEIVNLFSKAVSYDEELMRIAKTDGLERIGLDNITLARVFILHIVAGEPYRTVAYK